jgi:glyoxylase-like metal-dependent hydrolase (beta-lactamase superfamily II)
MRLCKDVYLVGSGSSGFDMTSPWDCHVYLVDGGNEAALIDAGVGLATDEILANCREDIGQVKKIKYVLITHTHADHCGGAAQWRRKLGANVYVSRPLAWQLRTGDEDAMHLTYARAAGIYPKNYRMRPCPVDVELVEDDIIQIGKFKLRVLATSGQCRGHISFYGDVAGKKVLFAGDTVFFGGKILLINTRDCNLHEYKETIYKLAKLKVDMLLPSHGSPSLSNGQRHLQIAKNTLDSLSIPPNLF